MTVRRQILFLLLFHDFAKKSLTVDLIPGVTSIGFFKLYQIIILCVFKICSQGKNAKLGKITKKRKKRHICGWGQVWAAIIL